MATGTNIFTSSDFLQNKGHRTCWTDFFSSKSTSFRQCYNQVTENPLNLLKSIFKYQFYKNVCTCKLTGSSLWIRKSFCDSLTLEEWDDTFSARQHSVVIAVTLAVNLPLEALPGRHWNVSGTGLEQVTPQCAPCHRPTATTSALEWSFPRREQLLSCLSCHRGQSQLWDMGSTLGDWWMMLSLRFVMLNCTDEDIQEPQS